MFAFHLLKGVTGCLFTSAIESHDATFGIENHHQCARSIQNRGDKIAFSSQSFLCLLAFRDISHNHQHSVVTAYHHARLVIVHGAIERKLIFEDLHLSRFQRLTHKLQGLAREIRRKNLGNFLSQELFWRGIKSHASRIFVIQNLTVLADLKHQVRNGVQQRSVLRLTFGKFLKQFFHFGVALFQLLLHRKELDIGVRQRIGVFLQLFGFSAQLPVGISQRSRSLDYFAFQVLVGSNVIQGESHHIGKHFKSRHILVIHLAIVMLHIADDETDGFLVGSDWRHHNRFCANNRLARFARPARIRIQIRNEDGFVLLKTFNKMRRHVKIVTPDPVKKLFHQFGRILAHAVGTKVELALLFQ